MSDMKKLNDEALENVTGGARRTVSNDSSSYSWVRSGPGKQLYRWVAHWVLNYPLSNSRG